MTSRCAWRTTRRADRAAAADRGVLLLVGSLAGCPRLRHIVRQPCCDWCGPSCNVCGLASHYLPLAAAADVASSAEGCRPGPLKQYGTLQVASLATHIYFAIGQFGRVTHDVCALVSVALPVSTCVYRWPLLLTSVKRDDQLGSWCSGSRTSMTSRIARRLTVAAVASIAR